MIRAVSSTLLAVMVVFAGPTGQPHAEGPVENATYRYEVIHPTHGQIGTYTNTVRAGAEGVSVTTNIEIAVKVAFVTVHRVEAERSETWADGRLVRYASTTRRNGETIQVQGRAEGDQFVIEGPAGRSTAPPSIMPTNAWSDRILAADVVMASESGRIYDASVSEGGRQTIDVGGRQVSARYFRMEADTVYELWFDDSNRVVQFTTLTDGERVLFVLS